MTNMFVEAPPLPEQMDDLTKHLVNHYLRSLEALSRESFRFIESATAEGVFFTPAARIEQTIHAFDYIDGQIKQHESTNTFETRVFELCAFLEGIFKEDDALWDQFRWIGFDTYYLDRDCLYAEKFQ